MKGMALQQNALSSSLSEHVDTHETGKKEKENVELPKSTSAVVTFHFTALQRVNLGDASSNIPPKVIVPLTKRCDLFIIQLTNPVMPLYRSVCAAETRQGSAGRNHLAFDLAQ
ncbi:hypothetical protein F2P81_017566 [Scophthalmus maximus]|uniref:Uncharacterized protein n=1 Tax=Scophthalmus maximus TaxID=52904 RepID=A0A6A4SE84_SCOMX|nr:hypothetical protein F2P81_017566 [Scophthalmus maximus]